MSRRRCAVERVPATAKHKAITATRARPRKGVGQALRSRLRSFLVLLAVVIFIGELTFRLTMPAVYSEGNNAIWLRHAWVGDPHTPEEYESLADLLLALGISHGFFHAGPFTGDGTVSEERIVHAADLVSEMKARCPEVKILAYLGQVEASGGGPLDLSLSDTRQQMRNTARRFLDLGFDGIHYDIEPIYSNNRDFIALLAATRSLTAEFGAELSVAACKPEPIPGLERFLAAFVTHPGYWSRGYFLEVAREVDQIAVMTYDTAIPVPFLYGRLVSWVVRWCMGNGVDDLLIGVPTYKQFTGGHWPWAENVTTALGGLKHGLAGVSPDHRPRVGAAVFAEWTTSPRDVEHYACLNSKQVADTPAYIV